MRPRRATTKRRRAAALPANWEHPLPPFGRPVTILLVPKRVRNTFSRGDQMLTVWGAKQRFCDGVSRRSFLKIGAFGAGLTLADMLRARAQADTPAAARSPQKARMFDRLAVIRSIVSVDEHSDSLVMTGYSENQNRTAHHPSFGSVMSRLRGSASQDVPPFVSMRGMAPGTEPGYLGVAHRPFTPSGPGIENLRLA